MADKSVVSREEWLAARRALLDQEKALTRQRDAVTEARRNLPWVKLDEDYIFEGDSGPIPLSQLFGSSRQLIIVHFMFGPDWEEGCKSCSFWADQYDALIPHLKARDINLVVVSKAPLFKLQAFAERMEWRFPWVSARDNSFNEDFHVSFSPGQQSDGKVVYNFQETDLLASEMPGLSVFVKEDDGSLYHSYSTYARGLDIVNAAYSLIDLTPKGRDEAEGIMHWVRLHDSYDFA